MLSSAKIGTSSWRYYQREVAAGACNYYLGAGEAPGRWYGRGLQRLGLTMDATVAEQELEATFGRAMHPVDNTELGHPWRTDGVTGFDLTFSAPKSVSAFWAVDPDVSGRIIAAAHQAAVRAGLDYLDTHAGLSRRGVNGREQVASAGLVAACFVHRTSRDGDPQLHTHALVLNKVACVDGAWRTLDGTEIYRHKKSAGMIYQAALRAELATAGLAFNAPNDHGQAELAGVPTLLMEVWSTRTRAIQTEAAPVIAAHQASLGRELTAGERARVIKTAVLATRPPKDHSIGEAGMREGWVTQAADVGWDAEALRKAVLGARRVTLAYGIHHRLQLVDHAIEAVGGRKAVFSRADLAAEVAARLPTHGHQAPRSATEVVATVEYLTDVALATHEVLGLGRVDPDIATHRASDNRFATRTLVATEARILTRATPEAGRAGLGLVDPQRVAVRCQESQLDAGQTTAVTRLCADGVALVALTAPAGAGKTRLLGAATRAWVDAGYTVIGLAPSARAAHELATATGGPTDTLAKWVYEQHRRPGLPGEQRDQQWALTSQTVVVIDEASMASTLDLDRITTEAQRVGAKVVLVGDPAQIGVINAPGGILAELAHHPGAIELGDLHRFTHPWEAAASLQLRAGDPAALDTYRQAGRIRACASTDAATSALFAHWQAATAAGREALMMARTRADVDALNQLARTAALAERSVSGPVARHGGRDWQPGDVLLARRNDRTLPVGERGDGHVRNGERYTVLAAHPEGLLVATRDEAHDHVLLPADYVARHADYGWATTIDTAQGATTDIGLLLTRAGLDRERLYVAMTRGSQENYTYVATDPLDEGGEHPQPVRQFTEDAAHDILRDALANSQAAIAAHALLRQPERRPPIPLPAQVRRSATRPPLEPELARYLEHHPQGPDRGIGR